MATDFDIFEDVFGSAEESDMINNIIQDKKIILTPTSINMNPLGYNRNDYPIIDTDYRGWKYIPATAPFDCEAISQDSAQQKLQEFGDRYTFITTYLRYWADVKTCDDYISIKEYKVYADDPEQIALARKRGMPVLIAGADKNTTSYQNFLNGTITTQLYCIPDVEFRIYRDRTWAMVVRYDFDDGTSRYFCVHPEIRKALLSSKFVEELKVPTLYKDQNRFKEQNEKALREVTHLYSFTYDRGLPYYKEVYSDADIKECAVADTRSHLLLIKMLFSETTRVSIIDEYIKQCLGGNDDDEYFGTNLRNEINNFFGVFNGENNIIWQEFKQRFSRSNNTGIINLTFLCEYITCSGISVKVAAAKDERANTVWPTLHWPTAVNGAVWERRDDDIICTRTFNGYRAAFVYNTKTKVRYVLKQYGSGKIKTLIPSLRSALLSLFDLDDALYLSLWNNVSIKELFANSNVGWILDNTSSFAENFQILALKGRWNSTKVKLSNEINGTTIGSTALAILATTGEPILEQLLKNKLFNLYFALLQDRAVHERCGYDMDKEERKNASSPTSCSFGYHGSAGSLKKMFGMTLDQLKVYDASVTIKKSTYGTYSYHIPRTYDFPKFLSINACNQLDIKTFTAAIQPDIGENLQQIMIHREFEELLSNNNPKQRVEFITKYAQHTEEWRELHDFWEEYKDYLQMRKGLRALAERGDSNIEYSDKWYPEKPGEAKKFIYYREGMHLPGETTHLYSPETFKKQVHREYDDGTNNVNMVTDEQGKIVGAEINMSPKAYLEFLHNELTVWYNLIKDEKQNALFQAAVERLKKYEYTDEKLGLSIVAPTSASDVQNEGSVLSHCVASFVDPIINGTENVVFIRRNDKLAEPYYTMAISPSGNIEQIHCYRNGGLDEADQASAFKASQRDVYDKFFDIKAFIRKWAKAKKGIISETSIKDRYGALCANR